MSYSHCPTRTNHEHARMGRSAHDIPLPAMLSAAQTSPDYHKEPKSAARIAMAGTCGLIPGMHQVDQTFAFRDCQSPRPCGALSFITTLDFSGSCGCHGAFVPFRRSLQAPTYIHTHTCVPRSAISSAGSTASRLGMFPCWFCLVFYASGRGK
jgi:hypothetical protein